MKRHGHFWTITKNPSVAQSNFALKLEGTTEIIDRLLLVPRQAPWKSTGPSGDGGGDAGGAGGGGFGGGL